jgi:tRNA threonylcarbamoyladenosine biosynthesis protein TsaB
MKVLAIDLSSARGSVAAADNESVTDERHFECERGRGTGIFAALGELRGSWRDLDIIAVGIGPGSYNGLRSACALANSIQMATGARVCALPSACLLPVAQTHYVVCGDARGGRAYSAEVRDRRICGNIALVAHAEVADLASKNGIAVYRVGSIPGADQILPSAPDAGVLALIAPQLPPLDPSGLHPIYLKPPHITLPQRTRT